jgi:hypothetical protein
MGLLQCCVNDDPPGKGIEEALSPVPVPDGARFFDQDFKFMGTPSVACVQRYTILALSAYEARADGVAILLPSVLPEGSPTASHIVSRIARYVGNKMLVLYKGPPDGLDMALKCFSKDNVLVIDNGKKE